MTSTVAGLCKVEKPNYRRIRTLVGQYHVVATPIHSFRELWIWVSVWRVLKVLWRGSESEVSSRHKPCKRRRRVLPWLCPQQRDCKRGVQQRALRWVELLPVTASPPPFATWTYKLCSEICRWFERVLCIICAHAQVCVHMNLDWGQRMLAH